MVRWLAQASVVIGVCVSTGFIALRSDPTPARAPVGPPVGVALPAFLQFRWSADVPWPELLVGSVVVGLAGLAVLTVLLLRVKRQAQAAAAARDREAAAREQAEAARRESEARLADARNAAGAGYQELAGGVAHDFNNLLTGILGNASLARELLPPGSGLHEYLRPIEKSAEHATQLCQQMLGPAGGPPRRAVDVNRLIEDAADLVQLSTARGAALRIELAAGLPPVEADPGQLRRVLLNLVQNASEALGASGGTITIRTCGTSEPEAAGGQWVGEPPAGPHVWVEVADTGCGMDGPTLARVFDPYYSTKFTGRGLGLAAVRGIVHEHRGAVRVTSAPGQGTVFRVCLPAAAPRPVGVDEPTPWPLPSVAIAPDRAALVVDDEPSVRKLAAISLRSLGFAVAEAAAGPEAVELFRADSGRFALVLLDLGLAGTDGRDVLTEVRKVRPDLPVVLTSGSPEPAGLPFGPTLLFLQKPFRPVDLKGCVRRVIGSTPG
ncbi:MAG TPA: ATP-binding protein [Fimbriiglobus sp.]|nr:ATP-binding protein [Fimbriiglobus sp.]